MEHDYCARKRGEPTRSIVMTYNEAFNVLHTMQSSYSHIRKNDVEWEAVELAKEVLVFAKNLHRDLKTIEEEYCMETKNIV